MSVVDLLLKLVGGVWRAVNVKRAAQEDQHTATEYADAFLFPVQDTSSDPSSPPSILDNRR